jgi:hypothetical protein
MRRLAMVFGVVVVAGAVLEVTDGDLRTVSASI